MLREVAWMIAGGLFGAAVFGASRWCIRRRFATALLPMGPHQFVGILRDEGEDQAANDLEHALNDPDEHEGGFV